MGSQLAFPLAMPLGGVVISNIRAQPLGNDLWLIEWDANATPDPATYMIYVDGKHWGNAVQMTSIYMRGEAGATPVVEIIQTAAAWGDPGYSRDDYFSTLVNNKIKLTWNPPADVSDVSAYRIYWDNAEGTVQFTAAYRLQEIPEDESTSYEFWTDQIDADTYKFVIRTVDGAGNESTNTTTTSQTLGTYPGVVTGGAIAVIAGPRVTITWTDPADIGAGNVRVYDNNGSTSNLFPDYSSPQDTVAAGVQTWTSPVLADGLWIFGLRVYDTTNEEPNTSVVFSVRLVSGAEVSDFPPKPELFAALAAAGKITLDARVNPNTAVGGEPTKAQFFTNDGAGGAVDYGTPLGAGFITLTRHGPGWAATLLTGVYGETARVFGARIYTSDSVASTNADEVTITPDATNPPQPLSVVAAEGRD